MWQIIWLFNEKILLMFALCSGAVNASPKNSKEAMRDLISDLSNHNGYSCNQDYNDPNDLYNSDFYWSDFPFRFLKEQAERGYSLVLDLMKNKFTHEDIVKVQGSPSVVDVNQTRLKILQRANAILNDNEEKFFDLLSKPCLEERIFDSIWYFYQRIEPCDDMSTPRMMEGTVWADLESFLKARGRDSLVKIYPKLKDFLKDVPSGQEEVGLLLKNFAREHKAIVDKNFLKDIQWLAVPKKGGPEFQRKMGEFLKESEDSKGNIPVSVLIKCKAMMEDDERFGGALLGRPGRKVIGTIFWTKARVRDWGLVGKISIEKINVLKKKIIEMLMGMKGDHRAHGGEVFFREVQDIFKAMAADNRPFNDDTFYRDLLTYVDAFIEFNEDLFEPSCLLERENLDSLMSGKKYVEDCVDALNGLLKKYPGCQEQIKEKFLATNLDPALKKRALEELGWAAADREEAFPGQGIMIGGDDEQSANFKEQNLIGENEDLKQRLKAKDLILQKFYEFQENQRTALLALQKSGKDFTQRMIDSQKEGESNSIEKFYEFQKKQQDALLALQKSGEEVMQKKIEIEKEEILKRKNRERGED